MGRLQRELETLRCMARIYCRDRHGSQRDLCPDCESLMQYAQRRLGKCPYGPQKPTCAKCPVHCYKVRQREQMREIMRYAGPRMTFRHPLRSLVHLSDKLRRVRHPMEMRARGTRSQTSVRKPGQRQVP